MTRELRFAKYQASGNDFLIVDELDAPVGELDAPALCDRWLGVGADGVIRVTAGRAAEFRFGLTNADGSSAEMSGNGMRCLGAYLYDRKHVEGANLEIETDVGVRDLILALDGGHVVGATVAMGTPNFTKAAIPMLGPAWETFQQQPVELGGGLTLRATALSMGNPHLVLFTDEDPERYHLEHVGPALEHHELFPERTNVEFARVVADGIDVRVWERGVGETLACGTGACAVAVAAQEAGLAPPAVTVRFRGGALEVQRGDDGAILLGGPVAHVFDGITDLDRLA
ncbi:MAG: diaminopimelate epimerase [Actinomycetota bacterium]